MLSNKLAFAALALACIGAAGAGGYLASRQNAVPAPASAQTVAPAQPAAAPNTAVPQAAASPAPQPVQETEAVVGESTPRAASKSAPPKRAERVPESRQARAGSPRHDQPPPLT